MRKASDVAYERDLYDYEEADGSVHTVDTAWGYESMLPQALDTLSDPTTPLNAIDWAYTLAPFVAGHLIRGPDMGGENHHEPGRLIEYQEWLAPIMAAEWTVLHFRDAPPILTSDRAFSVALPPYHAGHAIPLDPTTLLIVDFRRRRVVARWEQDRWIAQVRHRRAMSHEVRQWNLAIASYARAAIFGPSEEAVDAAATALGEGRLGSEFARRVREELDPGCHFYDYFRVLSAMSVPPEDAAANSDAVDWDHIDSDRWTAPISVETLFPDRTAGGVGFEPPDAIELNLSLGMWVNHRRNFIGDFRTGARLHLSLDHIRRDPTARQIASPEDLRRVPPSDLIDFSTGLSYPLRLPKRRT